LRRGLPLRDRTTEKEPSFQSLTDPGYDCIPTIARLGREPAASRYSADMNLRAFLGSDQTLKAVNRSYSGEL
jgi:hypothetical protein